MKSPLIFRIIFLSLLFVFSGCAFFNTYFNARKAFNNGMDVIKKRKNQTVQSEDIGLDRFALEPAKIPDDAKPFFDIAIEKANKVVVLHPQSIWVENAILLMGKAHYLRGAGNDYYDAKNRFEVFILQYPESKQLDEAKLWYAKTLIKLTQYDEAETVLSEVTSEAENLEWRSQAFMYLGDMEMRKSNYSAAIDRYAYAHQMSGDAELKTAALFKTAYVYYLTGDLDQANKSFNLLRSSDLEPRERFDVLLLTARTLKKEGRFDAAIRLLDPLLADLRYKNYYAAAELEIGDALRLQQKYAEASEQFQHVVDTYKIPLYSGDAYYYLGWMYDSVQTARWNADPLLAKKYYSLVQTKYALSHYFAAAAERLKVLNRMEFFAGVIRAEENLLTFVENRINAPRLDIGPDTLVTPVDTSFAPMDSGEINEDFKSVLESEGISLDELTKEDATLKGGGFKGIKGAKVDDQKNNQDLGSTSKKEIDEVKIENIDLAERLKSLAKEKAGIARVRSKDSLSQNREVILKRLADSYLAFGDFFNDGAKYDSALYYYLRIDPRFDGLDQAETALYSIAGIHERQKDPDWKDLIRAAYAKFPEGRMAPIARKILELDEAVKDSAQYQYEMAEKNWLTYRQYDDAIDLYRQVAKNDTSRFQAQALFAMGTVYEKQLENFEKAFEIYNTLMTRFPGSLLTQKVQPKVKEYARTHGISADSLRFCVDTNFVKLKAENTIPKEPIVDSLAAQRGLAIDSALVKFKTVQGDSLKVRKALDDDTMIKSRGKKKKETKDGLNHDEDKKD